MAHLKIVWILPTFTSPGTLLNGYLRHFYFIRELSKRHRITLLALKRTFVPPEAAEEMARYTDRLVTFDAGARGAPPTALRVKTSSGFADRIQREWRVRQAIREMKRVFSRLVRQEAYDVVVFTGKDTVPVIDDCNGVPLVVDLCDATSIRIRQSLRYGTLGELPWRLLRYLSVRQRERRLLRKTRYITFVSSRDRDSLAGSQSRFKVVPNGVDLAYWTRKTNHPQDDCIVFAGALDYPPNSDAAFYLIDRILPLARRSVPRLEALIVGRNPSLALREKARESPGVTVTGFVEDVRPYLERASVFVAPLRFASGMQNKLLQALAMEVPTVTTRCAAAGLRVEGEETPLLVADGERQSANCVVHLLRDQDARCRQAVEGRGFVEDHFDWSRGAQMLEEICLEAAGMRKYLAA